MKVAITNISSVLTDAQVAAVIPAMQTQQTRDLAPAYDVEPMQICFIPHGQPMPLDHATCVISDTSDQAGALGYHDVDERDRPIIHVFAKDDIDNGLSWTVTLSHELIEARIDPHINDTVFVENYPGTGGPAVLAKEPGDAVEADRYGYKIGDVLVSDFVLPAWFDERAVSGPYSFRNHVSAPFQIADEGYIGRWDGQQWTQDGLQRHAARGSRRERRARGRKAWKRLTCARPLVHAVPAPTPTTKAMIAKAMGTGDLSLLSSLGLGGPEATLVMNVLLGIAAALPGLLADITGEASDEAALARCAERIKQIPWHPAASAIDR